MEHMPRLGAVNADLVQKEPTAQVMDFQHMFFVLMALTLTWKARATVNCVALGTDVQVLGWKLLKCVLMGHTVTYLLQEIVFYVQEVIGEA